MPHDILLNIFQIFLIELIIYSCSNFYPSYEALLPNSDYFYQVLRINSTMFLDACSFFISAKCGGCIHVDRASYEQTAEDGIPLLPYSIRHIMDRFVGRDRTTDDTDTSRIFG